MRAHTMFQSVRMTPVGPKGDDLSAIRKIAAGQPDLVAVAGTEAIDLVDLDRAGGLMRFRAARDAVVLFEAGDGAFARFWFEAVSYWCDMGPIIRAGYDAILEDLAR